MERCSTPRADFEAPDDRTSVHCRAASATSKASAHVAPYEVLHETKRDAEIGVQGRTLRLSNREKVLYPRYGLHQGRDDRLLRRCRACAAAAPRGPAADAQALPRRRARGSTSTRSAALLISPSGCRPLRSGASVRRSTIDYCLAEDLPTLIWAANLAEHRAAHEPLAGARHGHADDARVRPRPRRAGGSAGVLPRGALDQGDVRRPLGLRRSSRRPARRGCRCTCRSTRPSATSRPSLSPARSPSC